MSFAANADAPKIIGYGKQQFETPACYTASFSGGSDPSVHVQWLNNLTDYRNQFLARVHYDDRRYKIPTLQWAQSSYIQPQIMNFKKYSRAVLFFTQ